MSETSGQVLVRFAAQLQRHVPCPDQWVNADQLGSALHQALASAPGLMPYVFDDQGHIRKHVAVFINGKLYTRRQQLDLPLANKTKIDVIQALSGG